MSSYALQLTRYVFRFFLFVAALIGLVYLPQITLAQQPQNDLSKAADILAQVNAWRAENKLWPLTINPTLEALAVAQASYVLPLLGSINDESQYHLDAKLRNPRDRAREAGWPIYGTNPLHIEVGENAGLGRSKFVMDFWRGSEIHSKAALSGTYREVGVAALPTQDGRYFYIMDFGARPGVLPVVPSADGKSLWLTDEKSRYAKAKPPTKVRLLDAIGNPLTDVLTWSPTIVLPDGVSADSVQVVYINGNEEIKTSINRGPFTTGAAATATIAVAALTATPGVAAANPTPIQSTRAPDVVPTVAAPAPTIASVPTVDPAKADILLTYDSNALFLRNASKNAVNISGLSMIGSGVTIGTPLWTKLAEFPADAFPSSHCLAVQLATADVAQPSNCKWTRGIINLQPAKLFWTQGDFMVSLNGNALAICKSGAGECAIDLP